MADLQRVVMLSSLEEFSISRFLFPCWAVFIAWAFGFLVPCLSQLGFAVWNITTTTTTIITILVIIIMIIIIITSRAHGNSTANVT